MSPVIALARHFYETRREVLAQCGSPATPWYRLAPDERTAAIAEAHIVLEALRRTDEEQQALQIAEARRTQDSAAQPLCNKTGRVDVRTCGAPDTQRPSPQALGHGHRGPR